MKPAAEGVFHIFRAKSELDDFMLREWAAAARDAVTRRGRFAVALSGGRTPVSFYERLASSGRDLPWEKTHVFLADERIVPASHPDSNYRMIEATLLEQVGIPAANVHPVPFGLKAGAAAIAYEEEIRRLFRVKDGEFPRFDLILLGLGADGHTASLFPGDAALAERRHLAVAVARPEPDHDRVSMTLPVINSARAVMFMVTGGEKAAILKAVIEGPANGLPAALVRPAKGRLMFLADEDAGALLREDRRTGRK